MKYLLSLVVVVALNVCVAHATQESTFDITTLSSKGGAAYKKLYSVGVFSVGGVGYAGETSEGELALYDLLNEKDAVEALKALTRDASFEGGLYGLLGLSITNFTEFHRAVSVYKSREDPPQRKSNEPFSGLSVPRNEVVTQFGCLISTELRTKLVASIQSGRFDKMLRPKKR